MKHPKAQLLHTIIDAIETVKNHQKYWKSMMLCCIELRSVFIAVTHAVT